MLIYTYNLRFFAVFCLVFPALITFFNSLLIVILEDGVKAVIHDEC